MKIKINSFNHYLRENLKQNLIISILIILIVTFCSLLAPKQYINMISLQVDYSGKHLSEEHKKTLEWEISEDIKNLINENSNEDLYKINATYEKYTNIISIYAKSSNANHNYSELKKQYKTIQKIVEKQDISLTLINKQNIQTPKIIENLVISILIILTTIILRFLIKYN